MQFQMIQFSPTFIEDEVINEVVDSLESGWITTVPKVKLIEEEVSKIANHSRTV